MAAAAAKAVWGNGETAESKQEPISGVNGDTSKGEPFDAGNMDTEKQAEKTEPSDPIPTKDGSEPAAPDDTTMGQNDTREPSNPQTDPDPSKQEVNLDEPGPKPLETVALDHGGDAGNNTDDTEPAGDGEDGDTVQPEEDDNGIQKNSHGAGTGEQWVKSSGLNADGGNFDAAAPGAGKEADRLLEKKGFKKTKDEDDSPSKSDSSDSVDQTNDTEVKPSLKDKIKAKLHAH